MQPYKYKGRHGTRHPTWCKVFWQRDCVKDERCVKDRTKDLPIPLWRPKQERPCRLLKAASMVKLLLFSGALLAGPERAKCMAAAVI